MFTAISDSRCPSDLQCVWQGDAVVGFSFESNGSSQPFVLHTHSNYQRDTVINGLEISLLSVSPYPNSSERIDPVDYSVELMLSNNEE